MLGLEGCTNAYQYCTNNWKPIVEEARDYIIAMIPVVNLIFLHYRSNHAQTHINSPEIRKNILHFFQVTKTCSRLTFIIGIFLYIYDTRVNKNFPAVALFLFSSSVITAKLLADIEMRFELMGVDATAQSAKKFIEQVNTPSPAEDDGLALFNPEWVGLLSSQARLWLNNLCLDCPLIEPIVAPQRGAELAEIDTLIEDEDGPSMEFPIKLVRRQGRPLNCMNPALSWVNPALCLLLCRTDNPDLKALVVLTINEISISGSTWRYNEQKKIESKMTNALLFPSIYTPHGSDEFKEQTKSLALLLGGESIRREGLIRCEEGGSRMGIIEWRLEDCDTGNSKSARKI